jgi:hypothetical protein
MILYLVLLPVFIYVEKQFHHCVWCLDNLQSVCLLCLGLLYLNAEKSTLLARDQMAGTQGYGRSGVPGEPKTASSSFSYITLRLLFACVQRHEI